MSGRMVHYLIEFRFQGRAKSEIKKLILEVDKRCRIGNARRKRPVPHITLVAPFQTRNERKLIKDFYDVCSKSPLMKFRIRGFNTFENNRVVYLDINPSENLDRFRLNLSKKLQPYCKLQPTDYERKYYFHSTVAMKLTPQKFSRVKSYIRRKEKPNFNHVVVRATLLKGGKILREYDFLLRRPLVRRLAKDRGVYTKTLDLLKAYFEGKYNPNEFIGEPIKMKKKKFFEKLKDIFRKPKTFITSDLHLDHTNIIKYCKRPFLNTEDMNKTLVDNWNNTISNKDTVYFLGDLAYGKGSRNTDYWLKQLNGKIIFIKGNHDKSDKIKFHETYILEYGEYKFFLSHEPEQVPKDWDGWAICGHHHNNKLEEYPFIDKKHKRINVSIELTKFRPVDMDELIKKIEK